MPFAARLGDPHLCVLVEAAGPHVGGPLLIPGANTVPIAGVWGARVTDLALCMGPLDMVMLGSFTVLVQGLPAARACDLTVHGGLVLPAQFSVLIGP